MLRLLSGGHQTEEQIDTHMGMFKRAVQFVYEGESFVQLFTRLGRWGRQDSSRALVTVAWSKRRNRRSPAVRCSRIDSPMHWAIIGTPEDNPLISCSEIIALVYDLVGEAMSGLNRGLLPFIERLLIHTSEGSQYQMQIKCLSLPLGLFALIPLSWLGHWRLDPELSPQALGDGFPAKILPDILELMICEHARRIIGNTLFIRKQWRTCILAKTEF